MRICKIYFGTMKVINPFLENGLVHHNHLDEVCFEGIITECRSVWQTRWPENKSSPTGKWHSNIKETKFTPGKRSICTPKAYNYEII